MRKIYKKPPKKLKKGIAKGKKVCYNNFRLHKAPSRNVSFCESARAVQKKDSEG